MNRGQAMHAYRRRDGYRIRIEGCVVRVQHETEVGETLFPLADVLTARTAPEPEEETRDTLPAPARVELPPDDITRVTRRPQKERA